MAAVTLELKKRAKQTVLSSSVTAAYVAVLPWDHSFFA